MGSKGSNTTTTSQNQTYNPAGAGYITNALNQGQAAASLPMNIPQAPVAGFSQDQQSAFNTVNNAQGMAQPYYNQASNLFNQSAQGPNISQFFNPYASAVTAQMNNVFGQQASQNTGQLTQAAGGVGADRIAVGQSELANQQGLAAGQTMASLYAPSLQAAQQQQNIQQGAAYGQASLGSAAQNAALSGAQAQLGTGSLQQQLSQAQLNSPYQQQLAQLAFPYQQAQFNAGITGALAPGLGGTTSGQGTSTGPAPSMLSQILGLGTAGVGAAGSLGAFSGPSTADQYGGGSAAAGDAYGGSAAAPAQGLTASDYGGSMGKGSGGRVPNFARGGDIGYDEGGSTNPYNLPPGFNDKPINIDQKSIVPNEQLTPIRPNVPQLNLTPPNPGANTSGGDTAKAIGDVAKIASMFMKKGGRTRYADGGSPNADDNDPSPATFDERFPYRMADQASVNAWRNGTPATPLAYSGGTGAQAAFPPPAGAHGRSGSAPAPAPALAATQDVSAPSPASADPVDPGPADKNGFAKSPWAALMAAGLGMAAGTSPFAAVNIGHGGLEGLKTLQQQREASQKDETIDQAAKRLEQEAKHHEDQYTRSTPYQQFEMKKPVPMGQTMGPMGLPMTTYGVSDGKGGFTPVQGNAAKDTDPADNPIQNIAKAIESGHQPPSMTGMYRLAPAIKSQLEKDGFNLTNAQLEYDAAHKQVLSLNGPQMVRFVGLAKSVDNTIDEANNLAEQMKNSGIPLLNQAKLAMLMQTEGNSPKGQLAARYIGVINTLKEEFANLANGGYAPTEPAWKLANEQINGNYGMQQLGASLGEVQRLIRYRVQGIPNIGTLGPGAPNKYVPGVQQGQQGAAPAPTGAPAGQAGGDTLADARAAISKGAPRDAVMKRLQEHGINTTGL